MRWVLGFCLGTLISGLFCGVLIWANGAGPPPLSDIPATIAYPTGSMATTLEALWLFYFVSFALVFSGAWAWRKVFRRQGRTEPRPPTPGR